MIRMLLVIGCVAACSKNIVEPVSETRTSRPRPSVVLVYDPAFRDADVFENKSTVALVAGGDGQDERAEVGHAAAAAFADELVEDLGKLGVRAERASRATHVPANAMKVVGEFIDVDEGNRMKRLVIGFGAGESRLDARLRVYDGGKQLLEFGTHSDSGKLPGGAVTMGAGAAATGGVSAAGAASTAVVGGIKAHRSAIEKLAARSGAQAADYLSEYFGKQGWIAPDRVKRAKQ